VKVVPAINCMLKSRSEWLCIQRTLHPVVRIVFFAILTCVLTDAVASAVPERELPELLHSEILPFYEHQFVAGTFSGVDNVTISYLKREVANEQGALIISPGRHEYALKYAELLYDLRDLDYSIYIIDHRGQGASGRMLENTAVGHVELFEDYVSDFATFVDSVVYARPHQKVVVLSHSMGSVIAGLYVAGHPGRINGLIFCSPMMEINHSKLSGFVAGLMVGLELGHSAIPVKRPFSISVPIEKNRATHSKARYTLNRDLLTEHPDLFVGSPTFMWVRQGLRGGRMLLNRAKAVNVPVLLLQAGEDEMVTDGAQKEFCSKAPNCTRRKFSNAWHELLMEQDEIRDEVLLLVRQFLLME